MTHPVVSVIVPTRNRPRAIESCLDALAAQTLPLGSFEVIVVDDGSKPPLALDLARWSPRFPLKLIHQHNTGPAGARNRGAVDARGEFLAFTDDDCLPAPTWLETLVIALRTTPEALAGGSTVNGLKDDLFAETSQLILELVYLHFNRDRRSAYFFTSNNMACSRVIYHALGGFDPSFRVASEDRDFCDRWRVQGRPCIWVENALIEHHHGQTLAGFTKLHFRYGQGAWQFHDTRRRRKSGSIREDAAFHRSLLRNLAVRLRGYGLRWRLGISMLILWWQFINAAGYFARSIALVR